MVPWFLCLSLSHTTTSLRLHRLLDSSEILLQTGIVRVDLETLLVRIIGGEKVAQTVLRCSKASPSLGPVRLDLGSLLGIVQGVLPVLLGGVGCGAVTVKDVVVGLDLNGLGELGTVTLSVA